jgi:hypothetical protein
MSHSWVDVLIFTSFYLESCIRPDMVSRWIRQRVCIRFRVNGGKSATEIQAVLRQAFGEESMSCMRKVQTHRDQERRDRWTTESWACSSCSLTCCTRLPWCILFMTSARSGRLLLRVTVSSRPKARSDQMAAPVPGSMDGSVCVCVYILTYVCTYCMCIPPLWSSGQSSWLQIRRPRFDSRHYQIFRQKKKKENK